jgi:FMN-dependent NADH-azoreductase
MYNFGIASTLKTWFDHVLRPGITFKYGASGPMGVLERKRAVVV